MTTPRSREATGRGGTTLTPRPALPSLRVAHVTEYYYPHLGGVCEHVHFFAAEARRRGHHVDVITSRIPGTTAPDDAGVIRLGRSQPVYANGSQARITVGWRLRAELREALRAGRYDLVHVHSPLTPVLPLLTIAEADCPVVGTFHTYFDRSLGYAVFRDACQRRLDRLAAPIAVSHSTTVALRRYFHADFRIIPNGVDTRLFTPAAPRPPEIPDDGVPTVLFVGRFDPRNGLATLIRAFQRVRTPARPARLVVVGDGPLRSYYERVANGDPDIVFVGAVLDGRPSYYAHSTVYACPTTKASFGITLLEAMACGAPVVCSDILGFRDVVQHEREALMFRCDDEGALADAPVRVLDDPALRARLGATGLERAAAYGWPRVTDAILGVYASVLAAAPR